MPYIDLVFSVIGKNLPVDHSYPLYSSISRIIPEVHSNESIGIFPISGKIAENRLLLITNKSKLSFRIPIDFIPKVLPIAGKALDIEGYRIAVGVPFVKPLVPAPSLYSRLVVIKGYMEPSAFLKAANRQLNQLGIKATLSLIPVISNDISSDESRSGNSGTKSPFIRRTIRIKDREIVGFALRADGLKPKDSILLQERGLGGRRRFGCGIFIGTSL